jgi:hypothetical protein
MSTCRTLCVASGLVIPLLYLHSEASAVKNLVHVETVSSYTPCGLGPDIPGSNASGENFAAEILRVNSLHFAFDSQHYWNDYNVWGADYLDPDLHGAPAGSNDTYAADQPNTAISFFQGHGVGVSYGGGCAKASDCTSPSTGTCVFSPYSKAVFAQQGGGQCFYSSPRDLVFCESHDGGRTYGWTVASPSSGMALGENSTEGGWRGAGTNGGTSLMIIHISYGLTPWFPNTEWMPAFAGVHMIAGMMVAGGGDVSDSASYGFAVANGYSANPNGAVSTAYMNAINNNPDSYGCQYAGGVYPGTGFWGCGCHVIVSYADTTAHAIALAGQSWAGLQADSGDHATGTAYYWYGVGCNYNPTIYGWSGGN